MELTDLDKKVIDELGLTDASDQEKEIMLKTIDERLEKRFIAKLLTTLPEDKQRELEEKVDKMENPKPEEVVEQVVDIHPNARETLEESAKEIIDELKQNSAPNTAAVPEENLNDSNETQTPESLPTPEPEALVPAQPSEAPEPIKPEKKPGPEMPTEPEVAVSAPTETSAEPVNENGLTNQATQSPVSQAKEKPTEEPAGMNTPASPSAPSNNTEEPASDKQDNPPQPDYYQSL